ncbi:MAG: 1-acyl-sn-glycerol-3-phosphate acyltransferase [Colwellia sp.]|nr:1-acyl-sn-glycerol-3-phosphate acyltransferase [Colwellia sp.]MCW8864355.1 1-acyl-sn-glycerol-3-phosphate acyltransferase [Colwellia sp.]MCW9081074.1 1-acyl-sn-glycerol-3-phosphate acyltransferase [Colwellia sp.]
MAIKKTDLPTIPDCIPRARGRISSTVGLTVLNILGWQIVGEFPKQPKFVVAVAPHTSNWDFVVAVAAMLAMNLRVRFMGKKAIFIWPFKSILKSWGGIAIDRNAKHGVVEQMVQQFKQNDQLILGIAPEGTRRKTNEWKSGFLHIAYQAGVPVVPLSLDFAKKELKFHSAVNISEDIDRELVNFKANYDGVCAKNPQAV